MSDNEVLNIVDRKATLLSPTPESLTEIPISKFIWDKIYEDLGKVPKPNNIWKELCFLFLGISIPSFLSLFEPSINWMISAGAGVVSLVFAALCFNFHQNITDIESQNIVAIREFMKKIEERYVSTI